MASITVGSPVRWQGVGLGCNHTVGKELIDNPFTKYYDFRMFRKNKRDIFKTIYFSFC